MPEVLLASVSRQKTMLDADRCTHAIAVIEKHAYVARAISQKVETQFYGKIEVQFLCGIATRTCTPWATTTRARDHSSQRLDDLK